MIHMKKPLAAVLLLSAGSLAAADAALTIVPGEWEIELVREGGATFSDSTAKDGHRSVDDNRVVQSNTMCLGPDKATLQPAMFAPNCRISDATQTGRKFEARLSCPHPTMTMTGNLTIEVSGDGKKAFGVQVLSGGGNTVGATMISRLNMKRIGDCEGQDK